jgi:hypothetical protein
MGARMSRLRFFLFLSVFLFFAGMLMNGCKSRKAKIMPPALKDTLAINIPPSTFRIPVTYSINELESFLNQLIRGQFLTATVNPLKNENDEVKVEMVKVRNISLSGSGNELVCRFPLEVTATILKSRLNIVTKGIKPVVTEVVLELRTPVALDPTWHLETKFDLLKTEWIKPPILKLAGVNMNLTEKLEEAIFKNEEKLTKMIDQGINKSVSLEKPVGKIWADLQKPIPIHKKPPHVYLQFNCSEIAGDFFIGDEDIVCHTVIQAKVSILNDIRMQSTPKALPAFRPVQSGSNLSDVHLYAFASFDEINEDLNTVLKGKTFNTKNRSAKLDSIRVYASDSGLTVAVKVSGDVKGALAATGKPSFDSVTQEMSLENFQFEMKSSNMLLSAGDALLHDMLRDTVQTYLNMGMGSLIDKVPLIIENAIAKGKTGKTIDVHVDSLKVYSCDIRLAADMMHLQVHAGFESAIDLKHLRAKKKVFIKPKKKSQG